MRGRGGDILGEPMIDGIELPPHGFVHDAIGGEVEAFLEFNDGVAGASIEHAILDNGGDFGIEGGDGIEDELQFKHVLPS